MTPLRDSGADAWWTLPSDELFARLETSADGLTAAEAARRLAADGPNAVDGHEGSGPLDLLWRQLRSPLLLLLVFAAIVAIATGEWVDAMLVLLIVVASTGLGWSREYRAETAARALRRRVEVHANVLRDGRPGPLPLRDVVRGDVVLVSAGSVVPGDAVLLDSTGLLVDEAPLTGESYPATKNSAPSEPGTALARRANALYLGTSVRSGSGRAVVVATGRRTAFGAIASSLRRRAPETEFERGLRRFGLLLTQTMTVMLLLVLVVNLLLGRPLGETMLFSVALAVGLSPELLPAILSVNLARSARMMASRGVLVRRLDAIESLGGMDVLCTDKTGTLTEGVVRMDGAWDADGVRSARVLALAVRNAALQTGLANPLDDAIVEAAGPATAVPQPAAGGVEDKLGEIPYDFVRRRLSIVVRDGDGALLIAKGAFESVLDACTADRDGHALDATARAALRAREREWTDRGIRVLAVASRPLPVRAAYARDDEAELRFEGFLTFFDRPKAGVQAAVADLARLGIALKLITGDSGRVARHVAATVGLSSARVLTGAELDALDDAALWHVADATDLFVEVNPNQKERIVVALRRAGHVVGFLGDGINDAPAMHAADTSLSVEGAVDVAREAADFVLLERRLDVIRDGVEAGRQTFANTLKYVLTTMSANLGNMISMAIASLVLPFLPLLAGQVLLNNFLSDLPAFALADDRVDPELVEQPRRWDLKFVRGFMLEFGLVSSLFDFVTFALLLGATAASAALFRTGWFVESLLTELAVALVVRTRRPFWRSRPGRGLLWSTIVVALVAVLIPYVPGSATLGFTPLPVWILAAIVGVVALYVAAVEVQKRHFYARHP